MKVYKLLISTFWLVLVAAMEKSKKDQPARQSRQYDDHYPNEHYGMPYSFSYSVYDPTYYNDYGHYENSDGKVVRGGYRVNLPDGRLQVVNYHVEGDSGFVAHVNYEGEAHYPDLKYEGKHGDHVHTYKPEYAPKPEHPEHAHPAYNYKATDYPLPPNYEPYGKEAEHPAYHRDYSKPHEGYSHKPHDGYSKPHYPSVHTPLPHEGYNHNKVYPHDGYSKKPDVHYPEPYNPAPYREPAKVEPHEPPKNEIEAAPEVQTEPPRYHLEHHEVPHRHHEHEERPHHHHEHEERPHYHPEHEPQYHAYPGHYNHEGHSGHPEAHNYYHAHDGYTPHTPHYEKHGDHYHVTGHDDPYPKTYVHYEAPPTTGQYEPPKIKLIDVGENFNPYGYTASKRNVRQPTIIYVRKVMT